MFAMAGLAQAQSACDTPIGSKVELSSLDNILATVSGGGPLTKDEFETTAAFEARKAAAQAGMGGGEIVLSAVVDHDQIIYDADNQRWKLKKYFVNNSPWNFDTEAVDAYMTGARSDFRSLVLRAVDTVTGSYTASNAMGAQVEVKVYTVIRVSLLELSPSSPRVDKYSDDHLFFHLPDTAMEYVDYLRRERETRYAFIPMPVERARELKGKLGFAAVASLREPFFFAHTDQIYPKMNNPVDATIHHSFLVADVRCGLVLDDLGAVLHVLGMEPPY